MMTLVAPYRRATSDDAAALPKLVNFAGDGLPLYLWTKMAAEGQSPWEVAAERAKRGEGGFSSENTVIREEQGKVAACLIGYPVVSTPPATGQDDASAVVAPLNELEQLAPGTWYVNVLATFPEYRGLGIGTDLLNVAETLAREGHCTGMSLIVADDNVAARRLYEKLGYLERATRPMVKEDWQTEGQNWVLLVKDF